MAEPLLIGLDVGTSGLKGLLVDAAGRVVASATEDYDLLTPRPGWTEQDPEAWWAAARRVLRELAHKGGDRIAGLGLTGQMHGSVFLDADHEVIRPALLWNDQRTAAQCRWIEDIVGAGRLREITGNRALTGFQAPKILWLRDNEPEAHERLHHVLLPKDFVRLRLTRELATDASDAAGTLLLDLERRDWSDELLVSLYIPRRWLPRVYEGPEVTGRISAEGARATGLREGLPVVAGGGDNAAAAVGSGVVREGTGFVSLGTSGVVFVDSGRPAIDPTGALHAFCHAAPGRWHLMAVILSAGGSLRWYRDRVVPDLAAEGADPYDLITAAAAEVAPGADGLSFLPYLAGERTPHMDPDARGAWIGLSLAHDRRHLARAVLEGIGFALADGIARMRAAGVVPERLLAVGGGARSVMWRKLLAAQLDATLVRPEVEEGPAMGAALLASVGAGVHGSVDEAVAAAVRHAGEPEPPDADLAATYRTLHARWQRLYPALRDAGAFGVA